MTPPKLDDAPDMPGLNDEEPDEDEPGDDDPDARGRRRRVFPTRRRR